MHVYLYLHVCESVSVYMCMYFYVCECVYECTRVHMFVNVCMYFYVCECVCVYKCMFVPLCV